MASPQVISADRSVIDFEIERLGGAQDCGAITREWELQPQSGIERRPLPAVQGPDKLGIRQAECWRQVASPLPASLLCHRVIRRTYPWFLGRELAGIVLAYLTSRNRSRKIHLLERRWCCCGT